MAIYDTRVFSIWFTSLLGGMHQRSFLGVFWVATKTKEKCTMGLPGADLPFPIIYFLFFCSLIFAANWCMWAGCSDCVVLGIDIAGLLALSGAGILTPTKKKKSVHSKERAHFFFLLSFRVTATPSCGAPY